MTRALAFAWAAITAGAPLAAQSRWHVSFGAAGAQEIAHSRVGTSRDRLSGLLLSGEAIATRGRLVARLRYGQGSVTSDTAGRDVAEGEALLGYKPRPWLTLWVGPHARTFVVPGQSDRRWLLWSGRVTARGSLLPGRLESLVEVWQGIAGNINRPTGSASGGGAEAGIEARLVRRPLWARLAYRIEQARAGTRRETVEAIALTVGYVPLR